MKNTPPYIQILIVVIISFGFGFLASWVIPVRRTITNTITVKNDLVECSLIYQPSGLKCVETPLNL